MSQKSFSYKSIEKNFDIIFLILILILIIGTPTIFTSLTRSVFEVSKLLLLRITTLLICATWLTKYLLFKDNGEQLPQEKSITFLGIQWRKIGLEIPILLCVASNILSTVFSTNMKLSIIGAYDRWEGIITALNYLVLYLILAKLVTKKFQLHWITGAILIPTACAAIYGIVQSFGIDFMNWSADPTARVFASINNPVHFCAYVGMATFVGFGALLYAVKSRPKTILLHWVIFGCTALIYYSQFLSFSKATWVSFLAVLPLFLLLLTYSFISNSKKDFLINVGLIAAFDAIFVLLYIFKIFKISPLIGILGFTTLLFVTLAAFIHFFKTKNHSSSSTLAMIPHLGISLALLFIGFIFEWSSISIILGFIIPPITAFALRFYMQKFAQDVLPFFAQLATIVACAKIQMVAANLDEFITTSLLLFLVYEWIVKPNNTLTKELKIWIGNIVILLIAVLFIPSAKPNITKLIYPDEPQVYTLRALENVKGRLNAYESEAVQGGARTEMWKSAGPWIKDYPIIGTGLDTIKYMYPIYRRTEYGIKEGGHNFTPDRLHNSYINELATKGIVGFITKFVLFIFGWILLSLSGLFDIKKQPELYLIGGIMSGALVYLGQVFFNFGVVATIVLFHILMGLTTAGIILVKNNIPSNTANKG